MSKRVFVKDLKRILKEGGYKPLWISRKKDKTIYHVLGSPKKKVEILKYLLSKGLTYQPVDLFDLDDDYIISWKE